MKTNYIKLILLVTICWLGSTALYAQNWMLQTNPPSGVMPPWLNTAVGWQGNNLNSWLNFNTDGKTRMRVFSNTANAIGPFCAGGSAALSYSTPGGGGVRIYSGDDPPTTNPTPTTPFSLLHIGDNLLPNYSGWRPWMVAGSFSCRRSDVMYVGLKQRENTVDPYNAFDAVVAWGDDINHSTGTDVLRFIFNGYTPANPTCANPGTPSNINGLEILRCIPNTAATSSIPFHQFGAGMVGIGDFSVNNLSGPAPIGAKLDILGDLRIRSVTPSQALTNVLVIDPNDLNRVHWRNINAMVAANNGLTIVNNTLTNTPTVQLGQNCGAAGTPGALTANRQIPMSGFDFNFTGVGVGNRVSIGAATCPNMPARLYVENNHYQFGIVGATDGTASPASTNFGVLGSVTTDTKVSFGVFGAIAANPTAASPAFSAHGVRGQTTLTTNVNTTAPVYGTSGNVLIVSSGGPIAANAVGVHGNSASVNTGGTNRAGSFTAGNSTNLNYGVEASANNSSPSGTSINYGGWFSATNGNENYGVYASYTGANNSTNCAAYLNGDGYATSGLFTTSDERVKENIKEYKGGLDIIRQLQIKSYNFKQIDGINFLQGSQVGLISQQAEGIVPGLVKEKYLKTVEGENKGTIKAINYIGLIPYLIQSVQELDNQAKLPVSEKETIDSMREELSKYAKELNGLRESIDLICSSGCLEYNNSKTGNNTGSSLLYQNIPNPFTRSTVIPYFLTSEAKQGVILLTDLNGVEIKRFILTQTGSGTIELQAGYLKAGIYNYSLFVDGELIDTRKMVLIY